MIFSSLFLPWITFLGFFNANLPNGRSVCWKNSYKTQGQKGSHAFQEEYAWYIFEKLPFRTFSGGAQGGS